jgi:RNA polymerase sigma-70 factor (ECF subfamily)
MTSEPTTLAAAQAADLTALLVEHRPRLLAIVQRWITPPLAARFGADDVLTAAALKAQQRWEAYRELRQPSAFVWLYRIAKDCFIDRVRFEGAGRRDYRLDMPWPDQTTTQLVLGLIAPGAGPFTLAARKELAEMVRQALDRLPDQDREILHLRYFDDLTFGEAGEVLDLSENAATQRCLRALRRLREVWRSVHGDEGFEG